MPVIERFEKPNGVLQRNWPFSDNYKVILYSSNSVREIDLLQKEGSRTIQRKVEQYSLDVIISVGYRVKSKQGTEFRIWANKVLKTYLMKRYALNEKKLQEKTEQYESLKKAVSLITNVTSTQTISGDQAEGLLRVLTDYTYALDVLDKYDHQMIAGIGDGDPPLLVDAPHDRP